MKTPIAALLKIAESLDAEAAEKCREMTQNPTPKRMKEYRYRCIEGQARERAAKLCRALAVSVDSALPVVVTGTRLTKGLLITAMGHALDQRGYYDCIDTGRFSATDNLSLALQGIFEQIGKSPADLARAKERVLSDKLNSLRLSNIPGFFPTPPVIVEKMRREVENWKAGRGLGLPRALEPSAGVGTLCDMLAGIGGIDVSACEFNYSLREVLTLKGHLPEANANNAYHGATDFLATPKGGGFDLIVMNPPFEKDAAIDHVSHAFDNLAPGGLLLAVVPAGMLKSSASKRRESFRQWFDGQDEDTRETWDFDDAFTGPESFRQTGVAVTLIKVVAYGKEKVWSVQPVDAENLVAVSYPPQVMAAASPRRQGKFGAMSVLTSGRVVMESPQELDFGAGTLTEPGDLFARGEDSGE